jgi:hypothetical protein
MYVLFAGCQISIARLAEALQVGIPGPPYHFRPFGSPDVPTPQFQWVSLLPEQLRKWLAWTSVPITRTVPVLLLLYVGELDDGALDVGLRRLGWPP